jgi:hypothetical protein
MKCRGSKPARQRRLLAVGGKARRRRRSHFRSPTKVELAGGTDTVAEPWLAATLQALEGIVRLEFGDQERLKPVHLAFCAPRPTLKSSSPNHPAIHFELQHAGTALCFSTDRIRRTRDTWHARDLLLSLSEA